MTANGDIKQFKKSKLRYNEYYNTQELFDNLYSESQKGRIFKDLVTLIKSEDNIKLAYRKIKRNNGSNTYGVNYKTIKNISEMSVDQVVEYIQRRIDNFQPHKIRRVEIPKPNGKMRPLGIPTIEDRIVQQCILQVLEPICEAKFYKYSYGFRPNRSTHHAIARVYNLINASDFHFVVDVDIKGFFDNVNHAKLLKQMWTLGIRDKNLLCIIDKMLKAEIKDVGIPKAGTPQGGILSPLLSNIVLNELDWWVASQWENAKTKRQYNNPGNKARHLRGNSQLKEMHIVRYADDFKIFCKSHSHAKRIFQAVQLWLKERLSLEISPEKSKITNLRKNYTEFLGIKIKAREKGNKYVSKSYLTEKSKKKCVEKLKTAIKRIKENTTIGQIQNYNSTVLGLQNYYSVATMVNDEFQDIAFTVNRCLYNKLRSRVKLRGKKSKAFNKYYGNCKARIYFMEGIALYPVHYVSTRPPMNFKQEICDYTVVGRSLIHENLKRSNMKTVRYLMQHPIKGATIEYNDNRISLYVGQNGLCAITKQSLEIGLMETHHIIPKCNGGNDGYANLIFVASDVHKLIHAVTTDTIDCYMNAVKPNGETLKILNDYRVKAGNYIICK